MEVLSGTNAWAVGFFTDGNTEQTLIEHWDGTAWSVQPSPNAGTNGSALFSVVATSGINAWAVGNYFINSTNQTLVEHWDGTAWSVQPSPNVGNDRDALYGVVATSATNAWAVGFFQGQGSAEQTLVEHWDGTAWNIQPSPNVGSFDNALLSVAVTSSMASTNVWAVGFASNGAAYRTLVEHCC